MDHVLHYETLSQEFKALMANYSLPVQLPSDTINPRKTDRLLHLGVQDLSRRTRQMINDYAKADFKLFGYEMIH